MISNTELPSTRPYLIRALYDWCSENGFTPYVAVKVDNSVQVPREYVQGGEIVLNVSMDATSSLKPALVASHEKSWCPSTASWRSMPVKTVRVWPFP